MRDKILNLLNEKGDLPSLPEIILRLQKMMQDPNLSTKEVAKTIELDAVLTGRILKLSNSSFFSRSTTPINTLPVAITKIGLNMLIKIAYSLKLTSLFTEKTVLENAQFWRHSLAVALFTQSLSRRIKCTPEEQELTYLAGLMHDIGIMVFGYLIYNEYSDFLKIAQDEDEFLNMQEKKKFGIDHAEIGAIFIDKWWQIDERVCLAVKQHHHPFQSRDSECLCEQLIQIANSFCNSQDITNGTNTKYEDFADDTWEKLELSPGDVDKILNEVHSSLEQTEEMIKML